PAVAVNLNVGFGVPSHRTAVDHGGEAANHAIVEHPVDPAFHRGRRQIHPLTDFGERGPRVLGKLGEDLLVKAIQPVHAPSHTTDCRKQRFGTIKYTYTSNDRRLIAPPRSHTVEI